MLKVGIIGVGVMGSGHARFIKQHIPDAQVVALSDVDSEKIATLSSELGTVKFTTKDPAELMSHSEVEAVIIASPDPFHKTHLELAIASGKPTLCEKPIATTIEDAREIASKIRDYESKKGKHLIHFGFMRRFDPAYKKVRELISTGKYGAPLFIRSITRNVASTGATTPGLYTNIAIHDFDIFRWMFNSDWVSVASHYPKQSTKSQPGLADPLVITAKMKNDIMMVADIVAFNNYGYDVRFEVVCESGSIEVGIFGDVVVRADFETLGFTGGKMAQNWMSRFETSYIEEVRAWVKSLTSGIQNEDLASVDDALAANEACQLGVASI